MKPKKYLLMNIFFAATLAVVGSAPMAHAASCGNGVINNTEACDDGDLTGGDGCSATCTVEAGWECVGTNPSVCALIVCGNDITQAGEDCDGGACCNADCTLKDSGTSCRAAAGVCDAAETCDGASADCPADAKLSTQCRASAGVCDVAETCDGATNNCPTDAKSNSECRASAGDCDVAENCTGSNDCPPNAFVSSATVCRASEGVCDLAENCTGSTAACPADAKSTSECRAANGVCDLAETCNGSSNTCPVDGKASSLTVCRPAVNPECDAAENCTGVTDNCPDDVLIGCGDGDGVDCTVSSCTVDGCVEEETCVEICRGPGFWQNHSGDEKDGENIAKAVIAAVGDLSICGVLIEADATTSLGSLSSALEGLCMRTQGVKQRQLYRQLVTAALNCSVSEGGTCDQITNRFTDIGFDDCSDLCAGAELPDGPTVQECTEALACFNAGGRIIEGECAKGTCDGDGETYCGGDEDCGDEIDCVRFEDSCRGVDLCSEDLEAPAQICPASGPASSPKLCHDARLNSCTIDSCE